MIKFDFEYCRPDTIKEALDIMTASKKKDLKAVYYSGGTELLGNFRKGKSSADVVIDIKAIKELNVLSREGCTYTLGACLDLNRLIEAVDLAPFTSILTKIADHTTRNKVTLGGNICGKLPYKEAVLPLLLLDASLVIAGEDGLVEKPLREVFSKRMMMKDTDLLVQIIVSYENQTFFTYRQTEGVDVDYPIIHLVAMKDDDDCLIALSGFGAFPLFEKFNGEKNIDMYIERLNESARTCQRSSKSYRQHLLSCALEDMIEFLEGGEAIEVE